MQALDLILELFEQISAVPRGTKHEARIREWLQQWASQHGLASRADQAGNLVIKVPASAHFEDKPAIVLQGHMDMVWQKTEDSDHDFTRDPIRVLRDGDWLKADRTTLGADNGIAIALMLALAQDHALAHPPLELLFTVEEEQEATGAYDLDTSMISGKTLINLDSEEEGVFTIGCSGGCSVYMTLPVTWRPAGPEDAFISLKVGGLQGGHSGGDIHKHRANANKLIGRALAYVASEAPIRIISLRGGTVRNAIPRQAEAVFVCSNDQSELCRQRLSAFHQTAVTEYGQIESGLYWSIEDASSSSMAVSLEDSRRMLDLLMALPNGVSEMSAAMEGHVETSNNIGIIELLEAGFRVVSSNRSAVASRLEEMVARVEAIARLAGAATTRNRLTVPWEPARASPLLKQCVNVYHARFGADPVVEVVHGGLECGIINRRCGGVDAISLGPTIINAHSPDESLSIPSVQRIWDLLVALLASF